MTAKLDKDRREAEMGSTLAAPRLRGFSKIDQRKEPRRPAHGTVQITRDDPRDDLGSSAEGQQPARSEIVGRLIDISANGFRAAHGCATMTSGEVVSYAYAQTRGRARVVWTRVMAGANPTVESGFVLLAET